jgi:hypothetical protein
MVFVPLSISSNAVLKQPKGDFCTHNVAARRLVNKGLFATPVAGILAGILMSQRAII